MWIFYAIISNIAILGLEYLYRMKIFTNFWTGLPYTITLILIAQAALFYLFRYSPTWLLGAGVFTLTTAILRTSLSYYLGEPINWQILAGVALMIFGVFMINQH